MPSYDCGVSDCDECQRQFPDRSQAIANYERRERHYALIDKARAEHKAWPCAWCLGDSVGVYDPQNPFSTVCPDCCESATHADGETGHGWEYERSERDNVCRYCGITEHDDTGYISDRERI